jgi:hypothetical protein
MKITKEQLAYLKSGEHICINKKLSIGATYKVECEGDEIKAKCTQYWEFYGGHKSVLYPVNQES